MRWTRLLMRKNFGDRHIHGDHNVEIMHKLGCCICKLKGKKELLGKHQKLVSAGRLMLELQCPDL